MPNDTQAVSKLTENLEYDTLYQFSLNEVGAHERVFDTQRLHKYLTIERRLIQIGLYVEMDRYYDAGGPDKMQNFIGHAHVEIEGTHRRGDSNLFIWGRFRNDWVAHRMNPLPTEEAWSKGFFAGTIELSYAVSSPNMGTLITGRTSFFTNPLREYEKKSGTRFGSPFKPD